MTDATPLLPPEYLALMARGVSVIVASASAARVPSLMRAVGSHVADGGREVVLSSLALLDSEGMLVPYAPKGLARVSPQYRDRKNPPAWVGMDVWAATICFNTVEAEKQGLSKPVSWQDLTKPEYKGKIVMPNPASSGTGFLDVSAWLQTFGEKQGWQYMDDLHQNIGQYVHSGSKPCKLAAAGEFPIGISFEYPAVQLKRQGAPLDIILPKEGLGWEIEATALIKGGQHEAAAKRLADFSASPAAMELYKENFAVLAQPGIAKPQTELPADYEQRLIKNDFAWASKNRDEILTEWRKRYDGKSEKVAAK